MDQRTTGLILRTRPLTETSLIVHWLTPDLGRIATVAKGARRPKSPFRGKLDLFYQADFSFARSRRTELHLLREVSLRETHPRIRQDLGCLRQVAYCAALLEQATEMDTPLPGFFELMAGLLKYAPQQPPQPLTVFAFETKLLNESGLKPDFHEGSLTAGTRRFLETCLAADWPALTRLKPTERQVREMRQFLESFLRFHLGKIPKGRDAAIRLPDCRPGDSASLGEVKNCLLNP